MRRRFLALATVAVAAVLPGAARAAYSPSDVPYLFGGPLPRQLSSPPVARGAPYTPLVKSLIKQLEPDSPPTAAELINADKLLYGGLTLGGVSSCKSVAGVLAPSGTSPSIASLCWADSVGVNITSGPNIGKTTATPEPLAIGATFDPRLANAWGQVEGAEARQLMVTGLYGPEADVSVQPNWERGLDTLGEDPFLNGVMAAAQVNGMQARGLMSQVKHFAAFTGANRYTFTRVQDQAFQELLAAPFEDSITRAKAASLMCAYEEYQVAGGRLPGPQNALFEPSPYPGSAATWPLNEPHWSCEQPLALNYLLRGLWHSVAFVGSDYPATHSTDAITQGEAQEFPITTFFGPADPTDPTAPLLAVGRGNDPTGDACLLGTLPSPCSASGSRHIGGIPGLACDPEDGCGLVAAVETGALPLAVFNQAIAEILYQEQRFGLLGCDDSPRPTTCTNPGGVGGDRSGTASLPHGPTSRATAAADLGTEDGDAAVVERLAEEGAVLLKDRDGALPLTRRDLRRGVAISGAGAEYLIAEPSNEASTGFPDRDAISPLRQLELLGGRGSRIGFTPALDPTGVPVPTAELSTTSGSHDRGLDRSAGPGSPRKDRMLDYTTASPEGQLQPGDYTWTGYLYVPRQDAYTFRFQYTPGTTSSQTPPVGFSLDGRSQSTSTASSFYCGQYYGHNVCVPVATTHPGYTQGGLTNVQTAPSSLSPGFHQIQISFRNDTSAPASFRFAYSRAAGDAIDAASAARAKAAAVVFVNDNGVTVVNQDAYTPPSTGVARLPADQVALINAVAAANPNTIVVMNTADPVIVQPWIANPHVRAVLEMWNAGSEGGTATARLLLGQADPSGHTTITWPRRPGDTIWAYPETRPLFPGDHTGSHPERLNGLSDPSQANCSSYLPPPSPCTMTVLSEGIFSGYRFFDRERLTPQFPFGYGLSYTRFRFSHLRIRRAAGGLRVVFTVRNIGSRSGTEVAQVYVGAGPPRPGAQQAVRSLRGFIRITDAPHHARRVVVDLDARSLQYWSPAQQRWVTDPGQRVIWVGDADAPAHLPLRATVRIGSRRNGVPR